LYTEPGIEATACARELLYVYVYVNPKHWRALEFRSLWMEGVAALPLPRPSLTLPHRIW